MKIFPNKKQRKEWKILSWVAYIGIWIGILSLLTMLGILIYQEFCKTDYSKLSYNILNKSNEKTMNSIYISPNFKGEITNMDILSAQGTIYLVLSIVPVNDLITLFEVNGDGFHFSLVLNRTEFVLTSVSLS